LVVQYLEDLTVGEVQVFDATWLVTEEEIREVGERWAPQPFHIDPEAAAHSPFRPTTRVTKRPMRPCSSEREKRVAAIALAAATGFRNKQTMFA
jgi:hypothetical protein